MKGQRRTRLAALTPTGDLAVELGANALVRTIAPAGDVLYIGGGFGSIGGAPATTWPRSTRHGSRHGLGCASRRRVRGLRSSARRCTSAGEFELDQAALAPLPCGAQPGRRLGDAPGIPARTRRSRPWRFRRTAAARDGRRLHDHRADPPRRAEFELPSGRLTTWRPVAPLSATSLDFAPGGTTLFIGGGGGVLVFR